MQAQAADVAGDMFEDAGAFGRVGQYIAHCRGFAHYSAHPVSRSPSGCFPLPDLFHDLHLPRPRRNAVAGRPAIDRHGLDPERRLLAKSMFPGRRPGHHGPAAVLRRADPAAAPASPAQAPEPAIAALGGGLRHRPGRHEPAVLSLGAHRAAGHRGGPGVHRAAAGGDPLLAAPAGLPLDRPGGVRHLAVAAAGQQRRAARPGRRRLCPRCRRVLGAVHPLRPARRRRPWRPGRRAGGAGGGDPGCADRRRPRRRRPPRPGADPVGAGRRGALHGLALHPGNGRADPPAGAHLRHPDEHRAGLRRALRAAVPRRAAEPDPMAGHRRDHPRLGRHYPQRQVAWRRPGATGQD